MKQTKLERVSEIFKEIQQIDRDVQELQEYAKALISGEIHSRIQLVGEKKVRDYQPPEEYQFSFFGGSIFDRLKKEAENREKENFSIAHELSEKLTLQLLAVLMKAKEDYKASLLSQLETYGLHFPNQ